MWVVKECTKCKEYKLLEDFYKHKSASYGVCSQCKKCRNILNKSNIDKYRKSDKFKEWNKSYYSNKYNNDYYFKLQHSFRRNLRHSFTNNGYKKNSKTQEILGCDFETFKLHLEKQFTKGMSWSNQGEWHFDHIYPVSLARDEAHLIKLNHYTNFQPLWAIDNLSKGNKIIEKQLFLL